MAVYPGSIPPAGAASAASTLAAAGHTALHNNDRDEIRALATKVGTGSSTAVAGTVLRATGAGTSAWGQVVLTSDTTGVLPVANGGTGQSSLTGLPLVGPVITGGGSWASPTLVTPTIASFTNAQHDHSSAATGGQLDGDAFADDAIPREKVDVSDTPRTLVKRTTNQTCGSGGVTAVSWDTEVLDVGPCHDAASPTRFTAPEDGLYAIWAGITFASNATGRRAVYVYRNGDVNDPPDNYMPLFVNGGATTIGGNTYQEFTLSQGEYLQVGAWQDSGGDLDIVANRCRAGFRKIL